MTGAHVEADPDAFPNAADKTFLLREFEEAGATCWRDVPDPIGLGAMFIIVAGNHQKRLAQRARVCRTERSAVVERAKRRLFTYLISDISQPTEPSLGAPSGGLRKVDPVFMTQLRRRKARSAKTLS